MTEIVKDFTTPDRSGIHTGTSSDHLEDKSEFCSKNTAEHKKTADLAQKPNTVTPTESGSREDNSAAKEDHDADGGSPLPLAALNHVDSPEDENKQVRIIGDDREEQDSGSGGMSSESPDSTCSSSQRGLVSRRGGRYGSPGRAAPKAKEAVLEYRTYRSPPRKVKSEEIDNVPSLCSTNSTVDQKEMSASSTYVLSAESTKQESTASSEEQERDRNPMSVSCNTTMIRTTSPLSGSQEADRPSQEAKAKQVKAPHNSVPQQGRKNNVTFSPKPPQREKAAERAAVRTPTRSPTRSHFQSLPSLDDAALKSPVGIFLSPHPPTPSNYRSLDEMDALVKQDEKPASKQDNKSYVRSPKTRDQERERFVATPTDFAMDYGKMHPNSSSFDTSNVLAWLQSPTANGLFSPGGGLGSIMNTPRGAPTFGGACPRTPRTPTMSTSFFFSDVAGLSRGDYASPKPGVQEPLKHPGSQRGFSNIICISPLASSRSKNGAMHQATTPINYKDVFNSPGEKSLPMLGDSPAIGLKGRGPQRGSRDPSLDAVHMAERDIMEDEDLSALLQLASNTPRSTGERAPAVSSSDGTHVFRSPNARKAGNGGDENLPSLQLPMIGSREPDGLGTRLSRKTHSRDHNENSEDFNHPLEGHPGKQKEGVGKDGKTDTKLKSKPAKKPSHKSSMSHHPPPYPMGPPSYSHPGGEVPYYPPMPSGMPPGGSMRVVVGGPPPNRGPNSSGSPHGPHGAGSPHGHRPYMVPGDPNYPPYPHPSGHYGHHPGVPPPHMQLPPHHPYHSHYPPPPHHAPPRHMNMYVSSHPPPPKSKTNSSTTSSTTKKKPPLPQPQQPKPTTVKSSGTKRPAPPSLPVSKPGSATKKKKVSSSPSSAPPKKKNKSPQLTDRGDRQKAAATIQAVNAASGGKNDRAAALAAAILRGVTMRPSGKWQAQLYFAGKSRYIGVFDTREKAALAYEIAREKLKTEKSTADQGGGLTPKATESAVNAARKAAFDGVNERDPRVATK